MLEYLLNPVSEDTIKIAQNNPVSCWGKQVIFPHSGKISLEGHPIVLVSPENDPGADLVREALYKLQYPYTEQKTIDLGYIKGGAIGITETLEHIIEQKAIPILISSTASNLAGVFRAFERKQPPVCLCVIDNKIDVHKGYLETVFKSETNNLFHYAHLGYQAQDASPEALALLDKKHFDHLRLGRIRLAPEEAEPVLRYADLMAFQLSAIRSSDLGQLKGSSPSGFFIEEACRLTRYAGLSEKMQAFQVSLWESPLNEWAALSAAQLIWYFAEGISQRAMDYPFHKKNFKAYLVNHPDLPVPLQFWKSNRTERWWMEIPYTFSDKARQRHKLLPCSYRDYETAVQGELSERIMKAVNRE